MPFFDLGVPIGDCPILVAFSPALFPSLGNAIDAVVIGAEQEQEAEEQCPCFSMDPENPRFGKDVRHKNEHDRIYERQAIGLRLCEKRPMLVM